MSQDRATQDAEHHMLAHNVDDEPTPSYERELAGWQWWVIGGFGVIYALFHVVSLTIYPLETWQFRLLHILGALILGFALAAAAPFRDKAPDHHGHVAARVPRMAVLAALICAIPVAIAGGELLLMWTEIAKGARGFEAEREIWRFGTPLVLGTVAAILGSWFFTGRREGVGPFEWVLILAAVVSSGFLLIHLDGAALRMRAGTPFASPGNAYAAFVGVLLILELTRRVAGLALVIIASLFVLYSFIGPWLPGFLNHNGFDLKRFFSYVYTDAGILGPTTAVSSTYIILFIIFAAFLQASKVGDYFVNFAFAVAGGFRGGPAKVAVLASSLMGMINGTSAGNVVATGSLTIPLMKKVGYRPRSAGAIEAAASTGGQILPPIMGAGAFIMAEITGIAYAEIVIAAIIPALLYFSSIFLMVDFEAAKTGMRGMTKSELPDFAYLFRQVYLFLPIIILIGALFMGYSVIRAGVLATVAAVVVSWLSPNKLGPKGVLSALNLSARMSVQIIAVCACAGVIVGVIALTGVGARFSSLLLSIAEDSQLLALAFAMMLSILLGMGMPTTAAYAVAASVVAPGLIALGIPDLVAHFFIFYYAVISAITPPVALAAYAAAGISGAHPMQTSTTSFKLGLAAFIVPFMFFYNPALLMEGALLTILQALVTALVGVYALASGVQGWFFGHAPWLVRGLLFIAAILMIQGGLLTDAIGLGILALCFAYERVVKPKMAG